MNTPTLIGVLVLGYLLLKNFGSADLGSNLTGGTTGSSPTPNPTSPTPSPNVVTLPNVTSAQLMSVIPGYTYASSDQWCYAYQHLTGIACPGNSVVGASMTADQFLAALSQYIATGQTQNVPTTYPTPDTSQTKGNASHPITTQPVTDPNRPHAPSALSSLHDGPVVDLRRMKGNGNSWLM